MRQHTTLLVPVHLREDVERALAEAGLHVRGELKGAFTRHVVHATPAYLASNRIDADLRRALDLLGA